MTLRLVGADDCETGCTESDGWMTASSGQTSAISDGDKYGVPSS